MLFGCILGLVLGLIPAASPRVLLLLCGVFSSQSRAVSAKPCTKVPSSLAFGITFDVATV